MERVMKREGGHISWESLMGQLDRTESHVSNKSFWQLTQMSWLYQSRIARVWTDVVSFPHDTRTRGILWHRDDKHYTEKNRPYITYNCYRNWWKHSGSTNLCISFCKWWNRIYSRLLSNVQYFNIDGHIKREKLEDVFASADLHHDIWLNSWDEQQHAFEALQYCTHWCCEGVCGYS